MKKIMLALCLGVLGVACRASGANMSDTSCTDKACADCTQAQKDACSDCSKMTECKSDEGTTCPVTGKSMN